MPTATALAFLEKVLLKVQKDSTKKHTKLRETLKTALDYLKEPALRGDESAIVALPQWAKLLNNVVNALKAAIETKSGKFATKALDCFLRLIANGLVPGAIPDDEAPSRLLLEKIVECIRLCSDTSDDATLLQIVKVIQAVAASSVCGLHGAAMKNTFGIVYKIHINSKAQAQVNTLSRTALSHVLNAPFRVLRTTSAAKFNKSPLDTSSHVGLPPEVDIEISTSEIELEDTTSTPPTPTPIIDNPVNGTNITSSGALTNPNEESQTEYEIGSANSTPREDRDEPDFISTKEAHKTPPHLETLSMPIPPTPGRTEGIKPVAISSEATLVGDELLALNDCLLLFNYLCKLSASAYDAELEIASESQDARNKQLALELLLGVLESSGPSFRNYERFIHQGLREHLSVALMVNGAGPHPKIYKLVLSIFLHVLSYFRDFMKDEIEDFVIKVLLRSLETASMMQQRWMSLQVILQVCKNPQLMLDIFINYDCDLGMKDIFERIVNDLSKVSQGNFQTDHKTSPMQDAQVKLLALEAIVVLLQSMVEWSHPLYDESQKLSLQSANGEDPTDFEKDNINTPSSPATMKELVQQADQFSKQKQFKLTIEKGKPKFALSAKKGVQYFLQIGVFKQQPMELALFFKNTAGLDKVKIGEYIGEKDQFNLDVMQCYVNLFNFARCDIDIAMRQFLAGFRLPGEAQKIDRIMEKFAERYYLTNSDTGTFASSESAYILAFAIVLLATDLHSSQIKKHMTKDEWLKMNRGNNAKQNFDETYLLGIYDRIGAERLKLTAEGEGTDESSTFMPKSSHDVKAYHSARNINHVKSMFSTAWHAILASFSVLLDQSDDAKVVGLILTGIKHAVRVSGIFSMDLERSAFIKSLSKFTVSEGLRDVRQKHIDSINALIMIAQTDGNYISDSWTSVQRCLSFLDRIHVYGASPSEDLTLSSRLEKDKDRASRFLRNQKHDGITLDLVVHQIDSISIDKIYVKSNLLSSSAVLSQIKALCEISLEEITSSPPSLFSLQKLAEIVYLNMYRNRPVWVKIWAIVADHFVKVGVNENLRTSMFSIETLRGLAIKVLEQPDLDSYTFQKELLRPFEIIFASNLAKDVQELIIQSFSQMILAKATNISSGWKNIFMVFCIAAQQEGAIMCLAFELIEEVLREYFNSIADVFFVECVNSFSTFANNKTNRDVSLRAVESLHFCAVQLANGRVSKLAEDVGCVVNFTDDAKHMGLWFPLLTGLSRVISHHFDDLRTSALDTLFRVLALFGAKFSPKLWELIFRGVLLPIFDNIGYSKGRTESVSNSNILDRNVNIGEFFSHVKRNSALTPLQYIINYHKNAQNKEQENPWLTATCMSAFKAMVEMFSNFIDIISFLLEDMLDLFVSCILQDNEYLSRISCRSLVEMLTANGSKFTSEMWTLICENFSKAFMANTPSEITELATKLPTTPTARESSARPSSLLRGSESSGFNSLPSRFGDRASTASIVSSSSITSSIASMTPTSSTGTSSNPASPFLSPVEPPPPTGARRRASVATGIVPLPDFAASASSSAPNLPSTIVNATPPPSPVAAVLTSSLPKSRADSNPAKSKLSVSASTRTQSHEELVTPDTRRRAASVAGGASPTLGAHSNSVPEIQKELLPHANKEIPSPPPIITASSPPVHVPGPISLSLNLGPNMTLRGGTASPPASKAIDSTSRMRSRCIVQLLLIHAVDDVALSQYNYLLTSHLVSLIDCLELAYTFSHKINKDPSLHEYMTKTGFSDLFRKQETDSISCYLTICFKLYAEDLVDAEERKRTSEERLIPRIKSILTEFVEELDVPSKIPIIKQILKSLLQLEENQFYVNSGIFYTLFTYLLLSDNKDVRTILRDILQRLGKVKNLVTV